MEALEKKREGNSPIQFIQIPPSRGLNLLVRNGQYLFYHGKFEKSYVTKMNVHSIAMIVLEKKGAIKINNQLISEEGIFLKNLKDVSFEFSGGTEFILATSHCGKKENSKSNVISYNKIKKTDKPWGYEILFNENNDDFCMKKIFIMPNHRTSLQFHEKKIETQFLHQGEINAVYAKKNNELCKKKCSPQLAINIDRKVIHRIEALTPTTIFEVSTPELEDVVRIEDDYSRA